MTEHNHSCDKGSCDKGRPVSGDRQTLESLLMANLSQELRHRKRNLIFKIIKIALLVIFLVIIWNAIFDHSQLAKNRDHVAVVDVHDVIMDSQYGSASADKIIKALDKAFANPHAKAIILDMNSPGGSAVQSDLVYQEIFRLRAKEVQRVAKLKKNLELAKKNGAKPAATEEPQARKIYAVIGDVCASGCYYIASATDEISANPNSIVGSIGVILSSFGFEGSMKKLGVDRRLITAGAHKAILDPFSPMSQFDKEYMQKMLDATHKIFIERVKRGRGDKLVNDPNLFSGLFWNGVEAQNKGLVDNLKTKQQIAVGMKIHSFVNYTARESIFDELSKMGVMSSTSGLLSSWGMKLWGINAWSADAVSPQLMLNEQH